jgi:hypothetical protein
VIDKVLLLTGTGGKFLIYNEIFFWDKIYDFLRTILVFFAKFRHPRVNFINFCCEIFSSSLITLLREIASFLAKCL